MRKPYFRKDRGAWFVKTADGKSQIRLAEDEKSAYQKWQELQATENPEAENTQTAIICEHFLRFAKVTVGKKTFRGYNDSIVSFCELYASTPVRDLKPFHVSRWLQKHPTWGAWAQRGAIAAVKRCFTWAVGEGLLERNPLASVKKPQAARREVLIEDDDHARMMLASDEGRKKNRRDSVFRTILVALRHSGARPGMVASVRIEDVAADLSAWVMHEHKTRKKTGKPLVIYLSPCLQTLTRLAMGSRTSGPLFLNSRGKAWTSNAIRCRMQNMREKLKLPAGTVAYCYRHTWTTTALVNGTDLATVAELLGHSDLKMLSTHYGHLDKQGDHLKKAAARAVKRGD